MSLLEQLKKLALRNHYECEDPWYSCPKSEEGCADDERGDECTCGADIHNTKVEEIYKNIMSEFPKIKHLCNECGGDGLVDISRHGSPDYASCETCKGGAIKEFEREMNVDEKLNYLLNLIQEHYESSI